MISNRREFLQGTGALVVCFALPACAPKESELLTGSAVLGNRLTINASGEVELLLGKVEFGQGIGTAMAQIAAEELEVDIGRIRLRSVDTSVSPDEFYTFSSISIQQSGPPTRRAAAAAREQLMQRAARKLDSNADTLDVVDGEIHTGSSPTGLNYWNLIGNDTIAIDIGDDQTLKSIDDYTIVGESCDRIDIPGKVFGHASYLQDLRLPDMVHARVVRPPAERATLIEIDSTTVEGLAGVLNVIQDGSFVAVVAEREGQARDAAQALGRAIEWALPEDLPDETKIYQWLKDADSRIEPVANKVSDKDPGPVTRITASYQRPYQAHASISPSAAIAMFDGDGLTVWSHAQGMYPLRAGIAHLLSLGVEKVRCIHREASGCYGHNGADDAACDAAAIAMHFPGRPVRLQWERSDEMAWEPYGSAMRMEINADVDQSGAIRRWQYDLWSCPHTSRPRDNDQAGNMIYARHRAQASALPPVQSIPQPNGGADRNGVPLYAFDSIEVSKHLVTDVPIRVSALRGLGAYANVFAIESFMDELAVRANSDPFDYRLRHLADERAIELLGRLRELSGWDKRPSAGTGEGWGVGFARFKNRSAWVGVVMHVAIDHGDIRLKHASAVCDAGLIINPDGTKAQIEGGIVQSASWTLKERVRFSRRQKTSIDWASYPILRFDEVPDVDVELMSRDDQPSLGVGEAAQGPTAAAIANAVFHATGKRLRDLPIRL
ncbi:MAG: molybdopterin cofactor-binding domain-containing protein [Woeseiaceae bacterium]